MSLFELIGSLYVAIKAHIRRCLKSREVEPVNFNEKVLADANNVVIMVVRNEMARLEHLLEYYREIGIEHFLMIDNQSSDNTIERLRESRDVSLFKAEGDYKSSRFGVDWINYVASKYCNGKWILHVDADEYFAYPHIDSIGMIELTSNLKSRGRASLQCLMLDMYSHKPTSQNAVLRGQDPIAVCNFFDSKGYLLQFDRVTNTNWIKGGVRSRIFFSEVEKGPALNKTPLVFWRKHYAFLKSSHQLWPYYLNGWGDMNERKPSGVLLHFKFLSDFNFKVQEESIRRQHTHEYNSYVAGSSSNSEISFYSGDISVQYEGWQSISKIEFSEQLGHCPTDSSSKTFESL